MDTDDLSVEAYKGIIVEADMFNDNLTLQFGLLSGDCRDEEKFLDESMLLINELKTASDEDLFDVFFGNPPSISDLHSVLDKIISNILEVRNIAASDRTYE